MTKSADLRSKLEDLALDVVNTALSNQELEMKEKTTALKTAADVYELLHKQDASGKGESAYEQYRERLAATATGGGKRGGNGRGHRSEAEQ